jgi:adenylate cyclase
VRTTDSLEAWLLYVRSLAEYRKLSKASRAEARKLAEQALAIDPNFGGALLMIGWTQLDDARFAGVDNRERALESAEATADKIAALYPDLPSLHNFLGSIYLTRKDYDRAMAAKRKAIELDPNNPNYLASTARALYYMGDYDEAISMIKQAMRLDPRAPSWYFFVSGASYVFVGDYGQAIAAAEDGLERAEGAFMKGVLHIIKAFAYVESGDVDEGRREVEIARNTAPYMTVEFLRNRSEHRDPAALDRYLGALRKAGMPETKEQ